MATQWIEEVRRRGQLRVYEHRSMTRGVWRGTFDRALSEFNALSRQHELGVTLARSDEVPAERGLRGADVMVSAAHGEVTVPYEGGSSFTFDGHRVHGNTRNVMIGSPERRIVKSFVYVPNRPLVGTGHRQRVVGAGVLLVILVHEFVHSCGLSNQEHTYSGELFATMTQVIQGATPAQDRIDLGRYGADNLPLGMPPLVLGERTAEFIQALWRDASPQPSRPVEERGGAPGRGPLGMEAGLAGQRSSLEPAVPFPGRGRFRRQGPLR